jgi:hypothetical protein
MTAISFSTARISEEIITGRQRAHAKHGDNSIEAVPGNDIAKWLPILGEEFGEVCESLTYDKDPQNLRAELIDLATVAVAWIAALDRIPMPPSHDGVSK